MKGGLLTSTTCRQRKGMAHLCSESMSTAKYHDLIFQVPTIDRWIVILNGSQFIEEIKRLPDSTLSFLDTVNEVCM